MAEQLKTITELPVKDIVMRDRRRPVSAAGVAAIRASIEELGVMQDPIHVRKVPHRGGEYVLMVGAHRLTAAIEMGWETIPVTCWKCNDDFAALMELDDNLAGAELSNLDKALFLAERKRVYERIHPEAKAMTGADLVAKRWNTAELGSVVSFADSIADAMGITPTQIRKICRAGMSLDPRDVQLLRKAPKPVALKDLLEISKIAETGERYHVVEALSTGGAKSASEARKAWKQKKGEAPAPANQTEQAFARLSDAWKRAPKAARARFLETFAEQIQTELQELVDGLAEGDDA